MPSNAHPDELGLHQLPVINACCQHFLRSPEVVEGGLRVMQTFGTSCSMTTQQQRQDLWRTAFSEDAVSTERLAASAELLRQLIALQSALVTGCRQQQVTWAQIGAALGVTAQAAQQKFGGRGTSKGASQERGAAPTPGPLGEGSNLNSPGAAESAGPPGAGSVDNSSDHWGFVMRVGGVPVGHLERVGNRPVPAWKRGLAARSHRAS